VRPTANRAVGEDGRENNVLAVAGGRGREKIKGQFFAVVFGEPDGSFPLDEFRLTFEQV
jgi:hypothetical protein